MQIWGQGAVKTNWGPGPVNIDWGPGPVNTNWEPGSVNTNCGSELGYGAGEARARIGGQAKERGPGNTSTRYNLTSISRSSYKSISKVLKTLCDLRRLKYDLTLNHSTKEPVGFLASTVQVNN